MIISPYFPPVNAADMHRVRTSLPYFSEFGWEAEVVTVESSFTDIGKDDLLLASLPEYLKIHTVKALKKKWTSKLGLGSVALRALWFYKRKVDSILKINRFDLIYFSTTQFPVCVLGAWWKKKFNIPYVIDFQDPWHSEYYRDKPWRERPKKYWFSYRLNKYLEPVALKHADGLIAVSEQYIADVKVRYPQIKNIAAATIAFGAFEDDLIVASKNPRNFEPLLEPRYKNVVYIGRGGADLHKAITPLFQAIADNPDLFENIRFYFSGTSYAPPGQGKPTIQPLAHKFGIENRVIEKTDRMPYFGTLAILQQADALFIPGSDDAKYTASKIYPYVLSGKPLLAIFHPKSPAIRVMQELGVDTVFDFDQVNIKQITRFFEKLKHTDPEDRHIPQSALEKHSARTKTKQQCALFNEVLIQRNKC